MERSRASHAIEAYSHGRDAEAPAAQRLTCYGAADPLVALRDHVYSLSAIAAENDVYPVPSTGSLTGSSLPSALDHVPIHAKGPGR